MKVFEIDWDELDAYIDEKHDIRLKIIECLDGWKWYAETLKRKTLYFAKWPYGMKTSAMLDAEYWLKEYVSR